MPLPTHGMHDLGLKILLDRYAQNDPDGQANLKVGDTVVAITEGNKKDTQQKREIGQVIAISDSNLVTVAIHPDDEEITLDISLIDRVLETSPKEIQHRVAKGIASVEQTEDAQRFWEEEFRWLMDDWRFVPGGRILTSAGTEQDLSSYNCFVIPSPHDSRGGIMETLTNMAEIMSRGGGVGINISSLRPKHSYVAGVNGRSSGSVSWGALYSYVTGLIEQAGCFAGDTRIATDKGLIPIQEIVERIENGEQFHAQTHQGMRRVTDKFRNGVKPLLKIRTKRGYEVKVTPNHPMLYLQDSKITDMRADMMVAGDDLLISTPQDQAGTRRYNLQNYEHMFNANQHSDRRITQPKHMTPNLAYLLGYSYGDGCVHQNKCIKLATADSRPDIQERLIKHAKSELGITATLEDGDGACTSICLYSVELTGWLKANKMLKEKAEDIRVPEAIYRSDRESMLAFIAGYFDADGSVTRSKKDIKFSSISLAFLQDIQMLLGYCGIATQIHEYERPQENWQTIYELYVRGSVHKGRFAASVSSCKDTSVVVGKRDMTNVYPSDVISGYPAKYRQRIYDGVSTRLSSNQLTKIAAKAASYGDQTAVTEIKELLNLTVDTIESIEELPAEETFDLTIEHTHMLSGNSVYTSNSRRGALMLILNDWHPDLFDFISSKREAGKITNANISVGLSDKFMEAVKADSEWNLMFPDTSHPEYDKTWDGDLETWQDKGLPVKVYKTVRAREIWDTIIESAWASAEPGMWFRERNNKMANSAYYPEGKLISTNPCGEQGLPKWAVCNLGALNLARYYDPSTQDVDWEMLARASRIATRFLDNVIDWTPYHFEENAHQQLSERRVGLGIMGLADLMIKCGVRYGSEAGAEFTDRIFKHIATNAYHTSSNLAAEKGSFPYFDAEGFLASGYMQQMPDDIREKIARQGIRNVTLLTVAPTGTTGTAVGVSTGIEPYFSWKWYRKGRLGFHEENAAILQEWLSEDPKRSIDNLPEWFVTSMELTPMEHVRTQAAAQRWVDAAISKTVNAPNEYTLEKTSQLYMAMYDMGCKGGTIYRDGSRDEQVLSTTNEDAGTEVSSPLLKEVNDMEVDIQAVSQLYDMVEADDDYYDPDMAGIVSQDMAAEEAWLEEYDDDDEYIYDGEEFDELDITLPIHPERMTSVTLRGKTPFGTMFINISEDPAGTPFAIFITVGKSGSDIHAFAESMGRTMSIAIQAHEVPFRMSMLRALVDQNRGIGGSRPYGFGKHRISSFADAVAKLIQEQYIDPKDAADVAEAHINEVYEGDKKTTVAGGGHVTLSTPTGNMVIRADTVEYSEDDDSEIIEVVAFEGGNMCPECTNLTLMRQDGCSKCGVCGYSEC